VTGPFLGYSLNGSKIPRAGLVPVRNVPRLDQLEPVDVGRHLAMVAVVRLAARRATKLRLEFPSVLVPVRGGWTSLDVGIKQLDWFAGHDGVVMPLALMTSTSTARAIERVVLDHPSQLPWPATFCQPSIPKFNAESLSPVEHPRDRALELAPSGDGAVFEVLARAGFLAWLIASGTRYVMIALGENLGAVPDPRIPAYMSERGIACLAEVVQAAPNSVKGGRIARRAGTGQLVVREFDQVPDKEHRTIRDFPLRTTKTLWIDVPALCKLIVDHGGFLPLPVIAKARTVDPRDPRSTRVLHLERTMAAVISLFERAQVLLVPPERFLTAETASDLVVLGSDAYELGEDGVLRLAPECGGRPPEVLLDRVTFGAYDDLVARFPDGLPSLKRATVLQVVGSVTVPRLTVEGALKLTEADMPIEYGAVLGGQG
jgi:UTP--glucose-1-phosphate uridylyltransferase